MVASGVKVAKLGMVIEEERGYAIKKGVGRLKKGKTCTKLASPKEEISEFQLAVRKAKAIPRNRDYTMLMRY